MKINKNGITHNLLFCFMLKKGREIKLYRIIG